MSGKPWYEKGLRFACAGCGDCCIGAPGYVWVNKAEIEAMAVELGLDVGQFQRKYVRLVGIRKSLIERADGDCVLFERSDRTCLVYRVRPRQCRTWPFWQSNLRTPEEWDEMADHCPGADRGPLVPLRQIRARLGVVRV